VVRGVGENYGNVEAIHTTVSGEGRKILVPGSNPGHTASRFQALASSQSGVVALCVAVFRDLVDFKLG